MYAYTGPHYIYINGYIDMLNYAPKAASILIKSDTIYRTLVVPDSHLVVYLLKQN